MPGTAGMVKRVPMHRAQARQRMWQSMRSLRDFTVADLTATAEVSYTHARKYVRSLSLAGYIACSAPPRSGYTGGHAHWRLVRDSGPYAPRIGRAGVRDPNTEPHAPIPMITLSKSDYARALVCVRACQGMLEPEREIAALRECAR